jgi:hypothetical protein
MEQKKAQQASNHAPLLLLLGGGIRWGPLMLA